MTDLDLQRPTHGTRQAIQIDIVSDVVCPWCYIGKRHIETALAQLPEFDATIHWRPYQLDPTIPPGGLYRKEYLARKFGERVPEIYARLTEAGRAAGLDLAFERIERSPNTLDAHRLIRWAWSAGKQGAIVESLFRAFFVDGKDVGDRSVLLRIAETAGMDRDVVQQLLEDNSDAEEVTSDIERARSLGVTGVPFFILAGRVGVSGAQPAENLVRAIAQAASPESRA